MSLGVKKLGYDSILPTRGSDGAVGYDLYSNCDGVIAKGKRGVVSTGIAVSLPPGVYGRVAPRSGLAMKNGIQIGAGVIDLIILVKFQSSSSIWGITILK